MRGLFLLRSHMRILVTDIDSTLSLGEIVSREVAEACLELKKSGWEIMVATGRTLQSALSHISQIGAMGHAIVYDGARCMRTDGTEVLGFDMSSDEAADILNFCWDFDVEIQVTGDELIYCRESDCETLDFCRSTGLKCSLINAPFVDDKIYRVAFWAGNKRINELQCALKDKFGERFGITRGGEFFLDVLSAGVSKGEMLDNLVLKGLIPKPSFVVAAGDHLNDFELLKRADFAAVPVDCVPELLPLADFVMPSVKEHGMKFLAEFLRKSF